MKTKILVLLLLVFSFNSCTQYEVLEVNENAENNTERSIDNPPIHKIKTRDYLIVYNPGYFGSNDSVESIRNEYFKNQYNEIDHIILYDPIQSSKYKEVWRVFYKSGTSGPFNEVDDLLEVDPRADGEPISEN
jgi:hypothetical protein